MPSGTPPGIRLAWAAFVVQCLAVGFHQAWHATGFAEPPSDAGHYLLLHFPLHLGVAMLAVAAVWLLRSNRLTAALGLFVGGAAVQVVGIAFDAAAVFASASHGIAAILFVAGGGLALAAAALRRRTGGRSTTT